MLDVQAELPPIRELLPHEPPMLLLDELVSWSPERAQLRATVRAGSPFVVDGRMPAACCLEYMAQAAAAARGIEQHLRGVAPSLGVLLGTRELRLELESLAVGDELDIAVTEEFSDQKLARYACELRRAGELVAAATLNVMSASVEELGGAAK